MNESIEAMKRVIAKRKLRGANEVDTEKCKEGWLKTWKSQYMQEAIKQLQH